MRPPPAGYARITVEQLYNADLELFLVMRKKTQKGVKPAADGSFPVEAALKEAMHCAEVRLHLQPLQARAGAVASTQAGPHRRPAPTPQDDKPDKQLRTIEDLQARIKNLTGSTSNAQKKTTKEG